MRSELPSSRGSLGSFPRGWAHNRHPEGGPMSVKYLVTTAAICLGVVLGVQHYQATKSGK